MDYLSSNVSNDAFHAVNIQLLWPKFSHDEKNPLNGDKSVIFKKNPEVQNNLLLGAVHILCTTF